MSTESGQIIVESEQITQPDEPPAQTLTPEYRMLQKEEVVSRDEEMVPRPLGQDSPTRAKSSLSAPVTIPTYDQNQGLVRSLPRSLPFEFSPVPAHEKQKLKELLPSSGLQPDFSPFPVTPGPILISQEIPQGETLPTIDPELGIIRVRSEAGDPELGILRIREQPVVPVTPSDQPRPYGFLSARLGFASSDNILLAVNDVGGLTGDEFFRPGISLAFYPSVGPSTFLIGTVDYSLQRYTTQSDINYDDLRFRLGVRQGLSPRTYGQLLFTYQQLFRPGPSRFRFFDNTALSLTLGRRDPLTKKLTLNSYYQIQLNEAVVRSSADGPANTTDFDRITQSLGGALSYSINPRLQTVLSYQVTLADYTGQERYDTYHQLIGQLTYHITSDVRMSLYGGWSFGRSSEPRINFDDTLFGITLDATIPLF